MAKKTDLALRQQGDSFTMSNTIAWCTKNGFAVRRVSQFHIKVGPWNCWPDKGSFNRDDMQTARHGVPEFLDALTKWKEAEAAIFNK